MEIAPESIKTRRAREKLQKQWESEKGQITPKALRETVDKINQKIADDAKYRVPVKEKSLGLFNANQNPAVISKRVQKVQADMRALLEGNRGA